MSDFFFEAVLPPAGRYCVVNVQGGTVRQKFFDTVEQMREAADAIDTAGGDAYFAVAAFDRDSRKAAHARELKAFFADLDCGPNKPYDSAAQAAAALMAFTRDVGFPTPMVVESGGGLHVYWPFTEAVPTAQWGPAAMRFKQMCLAHGLSIDPTVSADAARILRVPGTTNRKHGMERPVRIVGAVKSTPTPFEELCALLPPEEPHTGASIAALKAGTSSFAKGDDSVTQELAGYEDRPVDFEKVVSRCTQMRHIVTHSATTSEPMWRAALSIAVRCVDSDEAMRRVSAGHPGYDPDDTRAKAERTKGKPHTCAWFEMNNPAGCVGCARGVKSPITLGMAPRGLDAPGAPVLQTVAEMVPEVESTDDDLAELTSEAVDEPQQVPEPEPAPKTETSLYTPPYCRLEGGGVGVLRRAEDGNELLAPVYHHDLYITDRFYDSDDSGDGEGELLGLNLHLPHDGVRRFHVPVAAVFAKDKLQAAMAKHGVVAYGKQMDQIMAYLATSIRSLQGSGASNRTRNQLGWTTEGTFVVGEIEYTPTGTRLAPAASNTRHLAPHFHVRGTLAEWVKMISVYDRPGQELHAFAFLLGAGAPLLQLLNPTQVRGGMVNLVSSGSGSGKTTVQHAINSIFGDPFKLLMVSKDTKASMFQWMGTLNSLCMTVDEMTNAPAEVISDLVYGATSGRAAHRMEASTNKLRSNQTTWCTIVVTSSNSVMADVLMANKSGADGELRRVVDLHIKSVEGMDKAEAEQVFRPMNSNYGVAGQVYASYLVSNRESVTRTLKTAQDAADALLNAERADRFYSAMITVALGAGLIFNMLGLTKFDLTRIFKVAVREFAAAKDTSKAMTGNTTSLAAETLAAFINENINNTLVINSATRGKGEISAPIQTPKGTLKMRYEPDTRDLVIVAAELRKFFSSRRVDFKTSLESFRAQGALRAADESMTVVRRPGAGALGALSGAPTRCYVFNGDAIGMPGVVDGDAST